jgi:hypothetical protein
MRCRGRLDCVFLHRYPSLTRAARKRWQRLDCRTIRPR